MKKTKSASVILQCSEHGDKLMRYEFDTFMFLCTYYKVDVLVLAPSRIQNSKNPDIEMFGMFWELKSPKGTGKHTLERCMKVASKQSENIIIDLRRMHGSYRQYISSIEREYHGNRRLKRLKVITKAQKILDYSK